MIVNLPFPIHLIIKKWKNNWVRVSEKNFESKIIKKEKYSLINFFVSNLEDLTRKINIFEANENLIISKKCRYVALSLCNVQKEQKIKMFWLIVGDNVNVVMVLVYRKISLEEEKPFSENIEKRFYKTLKNILT